MKTANYKLAGSNIPETLRGVEIPTREAETLDEMHNLVADGKPENVLKLAQAQFDIIVQRQIRNAAESEKVADILAGKGDYEALDDDERKAEAVAYIQSVGDEYLYGARVAGTGESAKAKKAVATVGKLQEAAASNPEVAALLAQLGVSL